MKVLAILLLSTLSAYAESCIASVYDTSEKWGSTTSSGIPLDNSKLTMAHRTYKLKGFMRVTNRKTGKVIVLQVIDRGPYIVGRCVDLTIAAAKALRINGLGEVTVEGE